MLVNTLKSNQPFVIIIISLAGLALWLFSFIDPVLIEIPSDQIYYPFYNTISELFSYNSFYSILISFLLVLLQAFLLIQFNKKYILIPHRTYLPAFFYLILSSSILQLHRLNPVIIGTIFIFISLSYLFSTYRADYALNKVYLAGFFVSIASLFWAPFAVFFILIWISLLILRPFIGREWTVGLLGFLTPYLFVFVYYYVFASQQQLEMVVNEFVKSFYILTGAAALHFSYYIFYGLLLLVILSASYVILFNYQKKKIKNRKYFEINWWFFVISLMLFFLFEHVSYEIIYLISIPISFLLTDYYYSTRKSWYLNSILLLFYASLVYIQITAH